MDQSFTFTPTDAVYHYHSIYDSQQWQEVYADPGFHRHVRLLARLCVQLSSSARYTGHRCEASGFGVFAIGGRDHSPSKHHAVRGRAIGLPGQVIHSSRLAY